MLTSKPTGAMIAEWKETYAAFRGALCPNRRTGAEVDAYFRSKYAPRPLRSRRFRAVVEQNILTNEHTRSKLRGAQPDVRAYRVDGVCVGIDRTSGEFHVECRDLARVVPICDDLFAFRGLDAEDLQNFFLVAEYVRLTGATVPHAEM